MCRAGRLCVSVRRQQWLLASYLLSALCTCCLLQVVRRKNFKAVRSEVEKQLFAVRPTFAHALRQIQAAVSELSSASFAHANPNHTYTLQEYGELQSATREQKAKPALDSIADRIQKVHSHTNAHTSSDKRSNVHLVLAARAGTTQHAARPSSMLEAANNTQRQHTSSCVSRHWVPAGAGAAVQGRAGTGCAVPGVDPQCLRA